MNCEWNRQSIGYAEVHGLILNSVQRRLKHQSLFGHDLETEVGNLQFRKDDEIHSVDLSRRRHEKPARTQQ